MARSPGWITSWVTVMAAGAKALARTPMSRSSHVLCLSLKEGKSDKDDDGIQGCRNGGKQQSCAHPLLEPHIGQPSSQGQADDGQHHEQTRLHARLAHGDACRHGENRWEAR